LLALVVDIVGVVQGNLVGVVVLGLVFRPEGPALQGLVDKTLVIVQGDVPFIGKTVENTTGDRGFLGQEIFHAQVQVDTFVLAFALPVLQNTVKFTGRTEIMIVKASTAGGFTVVVAQGGKDVELIGPQVEIGRGPGLKWDSGRDVQRSVDPQGLFLLKDNIQDPGGAFRIVACGGAGDHFHPVNGGRGQLLEHVRGTKTGHGRGMSIDQYPYVVVPPKADGALHVHVHRGDIVQGIADVAPTGGDILANIVDLLVQASLHGGPFPDHLDLTELSYVLGKFDGAQVGGGGVPLSVERVGL